MARFPLRAGLLLVGLVAAARASEGGEANSEATSMVTISQCIEKGFQPGELACSTCSKLERSLRSLGSAESDAIVEDCKSCCSSTLDATSSVRYREAELITCRFSLSSYGGVNEFMEKSGFKDMVQTSDVTGSIPTLVLRRPVSLEASTSGDPIAALAAEPPLRIVVSNWKIESIEAFLRAKTTLQRAEPQDNS